MRVLRQYQDCTIMQSNIHAYQYSSLAALAGEAWNEWEIQSLVIASFFLQVFLIVSAPFRKRHRSSVLNGSLWIAYLMADYVATYLLGRLTLLVAVAGDGKRQELALFWAPFLLLHLGGQETITAFSMEDNTLWKRRLLDLGFQVAMAVYLVVKQWGGENRLLVAPMVLMFIIGAAKYGERIWALRAAAVSSSYHKGGSIDSKSAVMDYYYILAFMSSSEGKTGVEHPFQKNFRFKKTGVEHILKLASIDFSISLDFFMDVTPSRHYGFFGSYNDIKSALTMLKSSENRDKMAYKLAEMQLSLIHDYLYTKFGTVRFRAPKSINPITCGALQWLGSLGLTSLALVLFSWASSRSNHYSGYNVIISYILLVGAIVMEVSSIFIALVSSSWAGTGVAKLLHLHVGEMCLWSGKLPQYNMVHACFQERQAAAGGCVGTALHWMLASCKTTHVVVSREVKKLFLDKVLEIATDLHDHNWDFSRFQGQWAVWVASRVDGGDEAGAAGKALKLSEVQKRGFVINVVLWHLVTSICLLAGDGPSELANPSKDLSNYIMYLVAKCSMMVDSDGHITIDKILMELQGSRLDGLREEGEIDLLNELHKEGFIQKLRDGNYQSGQNFSTIACRVCRELLKITEPRARWELIAAVWTEILCYMALNCGAAFHAKHLTTGGEFLTQAKMLLFIIRLPFLRNCLMSTYINDIAYRTPQSPLTDGDLDRVVDYLNR